MDKINKDVEQYTIDVFVQDQQNQTNYQLHYQDFLSRITGIVAWKQRD
jgi:hypothetical protein